MLKLGVNIDHVATLRQARGGTEPQPMIAAHEAIHGGADSITIHLREDRRHIQDHDLKSIQKSIRVPLNLEMAFVPEMTRIALRQRPEKVCLVPERRQEVTTEGGLNACAIERALQKALSQFRRRNIQVSLFVDPDPKQILTAAHVQAAAVEIHTGAYAHAKGAKRKKELLRIRQAARLAATLGLQVHAGHGLDYKNVQAIVKIPEISELNIGHAIVSRAVVTGMRQAVKDMKRLMRR